MNKFLKVGGLSALIVASAIGGAVVMGTGTPAQAQPAQQAAYALQTANFDVLPERGPGPLGNVLTTVAKALGMDEAALRTELQAGKTIADLAKAKGVSAEALADAILAAHRPELVKAINDGTFMKPHAGGPGDRRGGPGGPGDKRGGPGGPMMGVGAGPDALAKALGLEPAALRTELQAGKSIADIAKAKSIDLATVKATLVKAEKDALAAAVTAGKLTQAQADKMSANIEARIDAMLNGSGRPGFPGGPGRGPQDPRPQQRPAGPKV